LLGSEPEWLVHVAHGRVALPISTSQWHLYPEPLNFIDTDA
jgi:hypothetical protein